MSKKESTQLINFSILVKKLTVAAQTGELKHYQELFHIFI